MDDLLSLAKERYDDGVSFDKTNRDQARVDYQFYAGEQWPSEVRLQREADRRPILTINRLPQFVRQVVNDARINPPSVKVRPLSDGADKEMADVYMGLIRNIEARTRASEAYTMALEHACIGGMGHFRIVTEYSDDDGWELDIAFRPIPSPFAVVWDYAARNISRDDAQWCFVTDEISREEFETRFPDDSPDDWEAFQTENPEWCAGELVRIAEYWYREPTTKRLLLLNSGETVDATDWDEEEIAQGYGLGAIKRERKVETTRIMQCLLSGAAVLEKPRVWPGKYIPIVPVIGEEISIGERTVRRGLVRGARDAQWMYNLHRSSLAEAVAMAPKAKWLVTPRMIEGYEAIWGAANTINQAYLPYEIDGGTGPQRVSPEIPSQALVQEVGLAAGDMEATIGIYRAALGQESNERSGRAIIARQREGDVGTYGFIDNLSRAVEQAGRILVDLLPRIYDTERVVRTMGDDGAEELVTINTTAPDGRKVFDLSRGKYDVAVSVGPSYTSQREEARDSMLAFIQAYPAAAPLMGDLFAEAMEWKGAEEIATRLRKTLPPGMATPKEGEQPAPPPQPSPEQMIAQAELMKAQAMAQRAQFEAQIKQAELAIEIEKTRQQGVKITDQGNAMAVDATVKLLDAVKPQPAPAGLFAG